LLRDIGVDLDRFNAANAGNRALYRSLGLANAHFFDKETWGSDRLVVRENSAQGGGRAAARAGYSADFLARTPLSAQAQKDLLRLYEKTDYLPGLSSSEKKNRLARMSYQDYLLNVVKVDKQALWFFMRFGEGNFCVGADATPALFAWEMGQPGFDGLALERRRRVCSRTCPVLSTDVSGRTVAAPYTSRTGTRRSRGSWFAGSFPTRSPARRWRTWVPRRCSMDSSIAPARRREFD
jgi:hypothetical protein